MKGSDGSCIPLCRQCHNEIESVGHYVMSIRHGFLIEAEMVYCMSEYHWGVRIRLPGDLVRAAISR